MLQFAPVKAVDCSIISEISECIKAGAKRCPCLVLHVWMYPTSCCSRECYVNKWNSGNQPELGTELPKTKAYIIRELERLKIPYLCSEKDSGILAIIEEGRKGKTVALRTDMDALPLEEGTGLAFASRHPGCMPAGMMHIWRSS